jgi:hypothetical protein
MGWLNERARQRDAAQKVAGLTETDGRIVLVEYDTDDGTQRVPSSVSFESLARVARATGYREPVLLNARGSRFLDRMYAAALDPA